MKTEAKNQLIKHIAFALIAWIVAAVLLIGLAGANVGLGILAGFMCAGVPFAWKWISSVFVACSIYAIAIKALLAVFLGWIAFPVTVIKDVVAVAAAD